MNKKNRLPKSDWVRDGVIAAMLVIVALAFIGVTLYVNEFREGPAAAVFEETLPPTTETTMTTGGGGTTTTTTSPSTTTTVPPSTTTTTTTTTVPEPTYVWDGKADFCWIGRPARLGVLRDEWRDGGPNTGDMIIRDTILSGVFQGAYRREITVAGDVVNAWFITMYMGEHPTTGRAMVVDFYVDSHPDTYLTRGNLDGNTIPEDHSRYVTKETCDDTSRAEIRKAEPEVILKDLEIGRQYLFMMFAGAEEFPDNVDAHKAEVLKSFFLKDKEVIDFLNGEREDPLPADAFGWAYRVYFPNSL